MPLKSVTWITAFGFCWIDCGAGDTSQWPSDLAVTEGPKQRRRAELRATVSPA
ncbi:MAG: hypothetical protein H6707_02535 [Deltaproteobacteria bacterium]|nr:hypothetical protein [Deltaproteobacteria bacterium]